ncbi:MAG: hypothetical protein JW807_11645 [Spirochaetes bacterium]|nr:hypothetical protein [Spirochaetota bacterium]
MKESGEETKRRLVLERFPGGGVARDFGEQTGADLSRLAEEEVATVFIISTDEVDADEYLSIVKHYEDAGFRVRNIHVGRLDERALPGFRKLVEEIRDTFRRESCLILSYGRSLAPLMVACYYVLSGESPTRAISRIRELDGDFISRSDEVAFVYRFKRFMNAVRGESDDDYIFQPLPVTVEFLNTGEGTPLGVPDWLREETTIAEPAAHTQTSPSAEDPAVLLLPDEEFEPLPEQAPSSAKERDIAHVPGKKSELLPESLPAAAELGPVFTLDDLIVERQMPGGARECYSLDELGRDLPAPAEGRTS